jgi:hypothetical protein
VPKSPLAIREDAKHLVNKLRNSTIQAPQAIQILCSYIEDLSVHLEELQKCQTQRSGEQRWDKADVSLANK